MRHLSTFALAGLFGTLLLVGDASACHKKKTACACPAPAPVACAPAPAPVCAPAPVVCEAPAKKHHMKMPKMKMAHHKKAATCETYAPITYGTPAPTMQYATPQASGQGM